MEMDTVTVMSWKFWIRCMCDSFTMVLIFWHEATIFFQKVVLQVITPSWMVVRMIILICTTQFNQCHNPVPVLKSILPHDMVLQRVLLNLQFALPSVHPSKERYFYFAHKTMYRHSSAWKPLSSSRNCTHPVTNKTSIVSGHTKHEIYVHCNCNNCRSQH